MENKEPILVVKDLKQHFKINRNFTVKAVDGISFDIMPGETYGLVGESGSGKSTTGRSIIRLYKPTSGSIVFNGKEIGGKLNKETSKELHTKMQMIFQDPMACLNPRKKVIDIIGQGLDIHKSYSSMEERNEKIYEMLELVGLSREHATRYPHQFSGGQRQRIGIARALIMNPDLIIADEAISALDVSIQAQVVNLMKKIQKETGIAYLFIAHDLSMVKYISDKIGVLHLGHLVETGTTEEIFDNPIHPYTKSLLSAIPHPNPRVEKVRKSFTYDYKESGVDYTKGTEHLVDGTHYVLATEEEFEKTRAYLEKINLYEMHIFKYSVREGTRAQKMSGHVPEQVKTERSEVLLSMAKRHKTAFEEWYVGRKEKVLLEEIVEKNGKKYFQGYTAHYVKVAVELTENDTKLEQNEVIVVDIQGFIDENLLYGKVSIEF